MKRNRALLCGMTLAGLILLSTSQATTGGDGPIYLACVPPKALQVLEITVANPNDIVLSDYPVALKLDDTTFNFSLAEPDGSDIWFWDPKRQTPLAHWVEAYDAHLARALIWVHIPTLAAEGSMTIWLVSGPVPDCPTPSSDGYAVFPFFTDVSDVAYWQNSATTTVTVTRLVGALAVEDHRVIVSDGMYNGFPAVIKVANGDWVLAYKKGINHVNSPTVVLRRSRNQGRTWSDEVAFFDTSTLDPTLVRTPLGDLLISMGKPNEGGSARGAAYSRSTDQGLSWSPFLFFDDPISDTFLFPTAFSTIGATLYGASYGLSTHGEGVSSFLWSSSDDGVTWTKLADIRRSSDEPGFNETGLAYVGGGRFLTVMRSQTDDVTFARLSNDMGFAWGPLRDITDQVGVLQLPQLTWVGDVLLLTGREAAPIPREETHASNAERFTRQVVAFLSWDRGETWNPAAVVEFYTGQSIDGGYTWTLPLDDGQVFLVYYADTHSERKPDIKSAVLRIGSPHEEPVNSLHVRERMPDAPARRPIQLDLTRYALESRLHSLPTPAGTQFALAVRDDKQGIELLRWELPSTRAAYPDRDAGFLADGELVTMTDAWAYNTLFRVRTIVDESEGLQQGMLLDASGHVIAMTDELPLAHGGSGHLDTLSLGSGTPYRATDSFVDWVFIRPAAVLEPEVVVSSMESVSSKSDK